MSADVQHAALRRAITLRSGGPVPPPVASQARRIFIDTLGCALAGRAVAEVQALEEQSSALEPGHFRWPGGLPLTTHAAAQVLAMAATWHEACEGHALAHGRPGVPVIAALLPLALARNDDFGRFIDALVLGYEVGARAGAWLRIRAGMHVDGNWPALGVAAAAAHLLGLGNGGIERAIDIAACQLPTSLYLPVRAGCTARNTYLGHSAALGLDAAFAVRAGIDAPGEALDFYARHFAAPADAAPGAEEDLILDAYLKPFAAVRHVHYGAVAARHVRQALVAGTQHIEKIVLTVYQEAITYCGNRAPRTPIQAQFSLSFGVAAMLRFGDIEPATYEAASFNDVELRRLEVLVELRVDEELTRAGRRGATLTVHAGGAEVEHTVSVIAGDPARPLSADQVTAKFMRYAGTGVPTERCERFLAALDVAPRDMPLRSLWAMLHGEASTDHAMQPHPSSHQPPKEAP